MKKVKEEWQEVRLGDILNAYIRGPFGSSLKRNELLREGIPVYEQQHAIYNTRNFRYYINDKKFEELKRFTVTKDDLIISCSGTLGKVSLIKENDPIGIISQALLLIRPNINIVYPKYLYYYFFSKAGYMALLSRSGGSVQINLAKRKDIENIVFILPPLEEQKKIASILSSLDDKIEINNRMNKILEETAQTIFKEWFINFNFPNEEGKPYKKSGGKMIESELGEIPKGWKVGIIKDISKEVICGKTPPTKDEENYGNYMPFITIPDMHNNTYIIKTERYLSDKGVNTQFNKNIPENSICVSCIATVGLVSLTSEKSQTNQQINSIIPKDNISSYWVYFYMKNISNIIINYASGGTTTLNLNKSLFEKINIIIPEISLLIKFNNTVKYIFDIIKSNQIENQKLASIRDSILPKLMNGEIRVK